MEPKPEKPIAKASAFLISEIKLSYNPIVKPSQRFKISDSKQAYAIVHEHWDESKLELLEQFKVLFLNRNNKVLGIFDVSSGGVSGTVVDVKLIFAAALKAVASGMILCHNHPSGNKTPSNADIQLTKKIKEGAKLLDIELMDHLIITSEGYFSFADECLM